MRLAKQSQFIPLQNFVYFITLLFCFVKYSHFTYMMCCYLNVHFQGQRVKATIATWRPYVILCPYLLVSHNRINILCITIFTQVMWTTNNGTVDLVVLNSMYSKTGYMTSVPLFLWTVLTKKWSVRYFNSKLDTCFCICSDLLFK